MGFSCLSCTSAPCFLGYIVLQQCWAVTCHQHNWRRYPRCSAGDFPCFLELRWQIYILSFLPPWASQGSRYHEEAAVTRGTKPTTNILSIFWRRRCVDVMFEQCHGRSEVGFTRLGPVYEVTYDRTNLLATSKIAHYHFASKEIGHCWSVPVSFIQKSLQWSVLMSYAS
jgi:hypothetical protein